MHKEEHHNSIFLCSELRSEENVHQTTLAAENCVKVTPDGEIKSFVFLA